MRRAAFISTLTFAISINMGISLAQAPGADSYKVTLAASQHGILKVTPALPADSMVKKGTVLTLEAVPADGYALDAAYYYNSGVRNRQYVEAPTAISQVTVDRSKVIGASFIEKSALKGFRVIQDVVYAQPGVKKLKYDVFSPDGAKNLPCIIIIHGGGWTVNTEDVMRGLARELVKSGKYVVFSIDYRWLGKADGDAKPNTMANIIEDVYGAIAHIQEHAKAYGADATRIAVTGDSAGGHLSAAAATMVTRLGDGGFGVKEGVYEYLPTYLPKNKSVAQFKTEMTSAIKAAAPSYGVFGGDMLKGSVANEPNPDLVLAAISPINNIQNVNERSVPQYLTRGTLDPLVKDGPVQVYADALKAAGQKVVYDHVEGASHAFFDWKPDQTTKDTFIKYGVPYAAKMRAFFDGVFYPGK